jgi:hypothetical protein
MLPNGGFPPLKKCEIKEKTDKKKDKDDKGFFYTMTNNINIREILKKNSKKVLESDEEEELDTVQ